uniref:RNase III domain-containing protein n=1 Tax=viral metagenome TaxID=1070528 RepID=A0A6C0ETD2_9ZZZZ
MEEYNPYNEKNVEIKIDNIRNLLLTFNVFYSINNMEIYNRAFVHRSYIFPQNEIKTVQKPFHCIELKNGSNERLEFLGDGILECVTKLYLYKRFPDADEGFMTEKKICLVKNDHIGKLCYKMGLHKWFIISKNAEEKKIRTNYKKLGCLFESFLGALFLDANQCKIDDNSLLFKNYFNVGPGFQYCQLFIENIYETLVDWNEILETDDNFKNILQVKIQKEFKKTPDYLILHHDEDMKYTMGVYLCLNESIHVLNPDDAVNFETIGTFENIKKYNHTFIFFSSGTHKIKKKAEQIACFEALKLLG